MCGGIANSCEHITKKTDLVRLYGPGPYRGESAVSHVREGVERLIQGPNSKSVKYAPSLCHRCNTTVSQPFDEAYDTFVRWLEANDVTVIRKRFIDFHDVYGDDFEISQRNLYKYFAKSFGCRLVDAGFPVPTDIVQLLSQESLRTLLRLTFAVNEDLLILPHDDRRGFLGKGDLFALVPRQSPGQVSGYRWDEHVSWFWICYWYNEIPDGRLGSTWVANSQFLYLGAFAPLDAETRAEAIRKAAMQMD